MLIPSQIRSQLPLRLQEGEDGVFTIVNAYEGDSQEFFEGRMLPLGTPRVAPPLRGEKAKRPARVQEEHHDLAGDTPGDEAELRRRVYAFLASLDPEKEADVMVVGAVFENLKRSGSLCVSQLAIETGQPLDQIFFALRQLLHDGIVEWRPDRSFERLLQKIKAAQLLHSRSIFGKLWRIWCEWRNGQPKPYSVRLIDSAWSIKPLRRDAGLRSASAA